MTDNQPVLWSSQTKRETLRLLRKRGQDFRKSQLDRLTEMILQGPPREMFKNDLTEEDWKKLRDDEILLRLYKLKESGVSLPEIAEETYDRIQRNRQWKPRGDHSEEFSMFVSKVTEYDPFDSRHHENFSEMSNKQFILWLNSQEGSNLHPWEGSDGWSEFVENDPQTAVNLLKVASNENIWIWISHVWYPILSTCRTIENVPSNLNQEVGKLFINLPTPPLDLLALDAARWLEVVWRKLNKKLRRKLWWKIWKASCVDEEPTQELNFDMTVNHTGGILASVLYNELIEIYPEVEPAQNTGIPDQLIREFNGIADNEFPTAKLARVRLSSMLYVFFRIDPDWTKRTFFRRMDPTNEDNFDQYLWEGFFWYSQCPPDLLRAIKPLLFEILSDLDRIPEHIRSRAVELFAYLAVPPIYGITSIEAKNVLWKFDSDKLVHVAGVLNVMLRDADERSLTFWNETLKPWFKEVWPTRLADRSPTLSESLAQMAMESGDAFPYVVEVIAHILTYEQDGMALYLLGEKEKEIRLVSKFPEAALILIDKLFHEGSHIEVLEKLLNAIGEAKPSLREKESFKRLSIKL